ncbi:MAG: hypothetical protein WAK25_03450, partial [Acidobacteriaceae bacterium]
WVVTTHLIPEWFAGMYFVLLFQRGGSRMGGTYLFQSKVEVVDAFVFKILSDGTVSDEPVSGKPVSWRPVARGCNKKAAR